MPNLDFARSLAVISVVVEHTLLALGVRQIGPFPIPYLGVLGVMVFFVLTSLVLMWSLERKPHILDFYIRRIFRIYPLALAALLAAWLLHAPTGGDQFGHFLYPYPNVKDMVIQAGLLQYVFSTGRPVLEVMWSLPYEMHMYLLLPLLFFFVQRNFSLWPLMVFWSLTVLYCRHTPSDSHNFAVAIGYFLPGVMAYVAFGRWKPRLPAWLLPVFLIGMWPAFLYHFNFHRAWFFCLVIGLALPLFQQFTAKPVLQVSRQIAKYSYGVYLTHPFAIAIGLLLLRSHSLPVRFLGEAVPLLVLPVLAYHLLENPMIRIGSRLAAHAEDRFGHSEMLRYREVSSA